MKKCHKKLLTSEKSYKIVKKKCKQLQTSEIKTQKCKSKWKKVTN